MTTPKALFILGPTASGKESLACRVAERLGGEIVSIDSMKVYRGMDIGTAKPPAAIRARIAHHGIDVRSPWEPFSARDFVDLARAAVEGIRARGRVPILSGGTVFYLQALLKGLFEGPPADWALREALSARARREGPASVHAELARVDPAAARRLHPNDARRVIRALEVVRLTGRPLSEQQTQWESPEEALEGVLVGLQWDREALYRRINRRAESMFASGLVEEVRRLSSHPKGIGREASQAVGYKEVLAFLRGGSTGEEALIEVKKRSRRLAKHQMTWLRRFRKIAWLPAGEASDPDALCRSVCGLWERGPA